MIPFEQIKPSDSQLGGKALGLGILAQRGFAVPPGIVLCAEPKQEEWPEILGWWHSIGMAPLAVRSSAGAEDSAETSFAGQNRTFLNVATELGLRQAVHECFESVHRESSRAYRRFFRREEGGRMNVVLQKMVRPKFSGVFFSQDPVRAEGGWLLEVIPGLGEALVSGKVTPGRMQQGGEASCLPAGFAEVQGEAVAKCGLSVSRELGFPVDMEWSIDEEGKLQVLQARPITTSASKQNSSQLELSRLEAAFAPHTHWDGKTFAEWSGLPSPFTFSLWERAFSPRHAFGAALQEVGYRGFREREWKLGESLLNRVFGRAYVNLDRLNDLYFGDIPYRIEIEPRPRARFDLSRLGFHSFLSFPSAASTMLRVGWRLSTGRGRYLKTCLADLSLLKNRFERPRDAGSLSGLSLEKLLEELESQSEEFSASILRWPLVLVMLTEATTQALHHQTVKALGDTEAESRIRRWLGSGLHTVTFEMQKELALASRDPHLRAAFLARFGHRGPGEMDLRHPRWRELGDAPFRGQLLSRQNEADKIEAEIHAIPSFRRDLILEEWRWLKRLLEARETWKMELLKPYAWIRELLLELGRRTGLGENVHYLFLEELLELRGGGPDLLRAAADKARARITEEKEFRSYSLPDSLALASLRDLLKPSQDTAGQLQLDGQALSGGVAYGEVRFVTDPASENPELWPENVILAADSTDPGWTALFARAKGIVVEHGGVLSHCAILAREMGLPAVGGIRNLAGKIRSGEKIWIDGNHGRITRDRT